MSQQKPFGRPCIICGRRRFVQRGECAICTCVLYDGFAVYESAVELKQSLQRATNDNDDDVCVFVNDTHTHKTLTHKRKRLAMSILGGMLSSWHTVVIIVSVGVGSVVLVGWVGLVWFCLAWARVHITHHSVLLYYTNV